MTSFEAIALVTIGSFAAWRAVQHFTPRLVSSARTRVAKRFLHPKQSATAHRIGTLLTPSSSRPSSGCGSGCSSCAGCPVAEVKSDLRNAAATAVQTDGRVQP